MKAGRGCRDGAGLPGIDCLVAVGIHRLDRAAKVWRNRKLAHPVQIDLSGELDEPFAARQHLFHDPRDTADRR